MVISVHLAYIIKVPPFSLTLFPVILKTIAECRKRRQIGRTRGRREHSLTSGPFTALKHNACYMMTFFRF